MYPLFTSSNNQQYLMIMIDFSFFYKKKYFEGGIPEDSNYDFFFSAYDDCERTKHLFAKIDSKVKFWILFPHYKINETLDNCFVYPGFEEDNDEFIQFINSLGIDHSTKICIDITGYLRPHLIFFSMLLQRKGVSKIDYLYTEPKYYNNSEETKFSGLVSEKPRLVNGCGSLMSNPDFEKDLLIINAGYDDKLISAISSDKAKINNKVLIIGFPSLQPDMYQENILMINKAKDEIGKINEQRYAPANDPFVTANTIMEIVETNASSQNVYLSPLSTKPQTLGVLLYYVWFKNLKSLNIIFPFSNSYIPKTAIGINYTWIYTLEFPKI